MTLGADRKKIYILGGLLVVGGYLFYSNVLSGPSSPEPARPVRVAAVPGAARNKGPAIGDAPAAADEQAPSTRKTPSARSSEEFRPSLKPKRPEERVDPMTIDPTLRLDLLAKVQAVNMEGGRRNLFQASAPPPAPLPKEPSIAIAKNRGMVGPQPAPKPAAPPPPPPPPPINLKYYGYSSARGDNRKRAFFLDGDDILVAAEGETVKKRYRVVRIGVNSVVMEDTQFKHEQTLQLAEEAAG
jgi:hypothetical protein